MTKKVDCDKIKVTFDLLSKGDDILAKRKRGASVGLLKRFLPYYSKYKWIMVADLFCASLTTICELILPMIVRKITNAATAEVMTLTVGMIIGCGVLYLVLRIIDTAANYYMASVGHIMGTKIETDMRRDFFGHLQKLFDGTGTVKQTVMRVNVQVDKICCHIIYVIQWLFCLN